MTEKYLLFPFPSDSGAFQIAVDAALRYDLKPLVVTDKEQITLGNRILCSVIHIPKKLFNIKLINELTKFKNIVGILNTSEYYAVEGSEIAEKLRLSGNSPKNVLSARNKFILRNRLDELGIDQPKYSIVTEINEIVQFAEENGYPIVVKPSSSSQSSGVTVCYQLREVEEAFAKAKKENQRIELKHSIADSHILVEEYISGDEFSVEMVNNVAICATQKSKSGVIELCHSLPDLSKNGKVAIDVALKAVQLMQLNKSSNHVEVIVKNNKGYLIEINPRPAGGNIAKLLYYVYENSYGDALIESALGIFNEKKYIDSFCSDMRAASVHFYTPTNNNLKLNYFSQMTLDNNVKEFSLNYFKRKNLTKDNRDRIGYVITIGSDINESKQNAKKFINQYITEEGNKEFLDNYLPQSDLTICAQLSGMTFGENEEFVPSINLSTSFKRSPWSSSSNELIYSRSDNQTFIPAERTIAQLERGYEALLFASGMAAMQTFIMSLPKDSLIIAPKNSYAGTWEWLNNVVSKTKNIKVKFIDYNTESLSSLIYHHKGLKCIWLETPSTPGLILTDIEKIVKIAKNFPQTFVIVDNTSSTPILTKPITLGADFVIHSATKGLNGHDDALLGAIISKTPSQMWEKIRYMRNKTGCVPGSLESWLLARGLRTLSLRVINSNKNAEIIANWLHSNKHEVIKDVRYPKLNSQPISQLVDSQMNGYGGTQISLLMRDGEFSALQLMHHVRLWRPGTSFGGVQSFLEHRASVEANYLPTPKNLVRLSVGLESVEDLIYDLNQAFDKLLD